MRNSGPRSHELASRTAKPDAKHICDKVKALFLFVLNESDLDLLKFEYLESQSRHTLNTRNVGEKPNATEPVEGINPMWNDLIFVETVEGNNMANEGK